MSQCLNAFQGWLPKTSLVLLCAFFLTLVSSPSKAQPINLADSNIAKVDSTKDLLESNLPLDPLDSPHPIPWHWIVETQTSLGQQGKTSIVYYRSPSLLSPDGKYAVYSRLQMEVAPEMHQSRVTSLMFVENLATGELRILQANSPMTLDPETKSMGGIISVLMPVSWSVDGKRLLSRQFEGLFNTSDASDYAMVWDMESDQTTSITPDLDSYEQSILLGWSQIAPERVLFTSGNLGDEEWDLCAVNIQGETTIASTEKTIIYGEIDKTDWMGAQILSK
jgi:hypothetical protein